MNTTAHPANYNIAVLGPHHRGRVSLNAHRPEEGFRITRLCGHSPEGLEEYATRIGSPPSFTQDYRVIAEDPEIHIVFVCSPDYLHEEHAIAMLEAGKIVFLEKPMAISVVGCDRILDTARAFRSRLYVGHNMRFFPVMRKMHSLVAEGRIGEVQAIWCRHFVGHGGDFYFKNYNAERERTTSLLLQKGAHDIDIIHWLAGAYTRRVVGFGKLSVYNQIKDRKEEGTYFRQKSDHNLSAWPPLSHTRINPRVDIEDHNMILMQLENGVQASYAECFYSPDYHRNYTIIGTEGRIENYGDHSTPKEEASIQLWNHRCNYRSVGHEVYHIPFVDGGHGGADPLMIADFLRFVKSGESQESASPLSARMAVAVGCCGAESIRSEGTPINIPACANP